jgi:SET domain-containing protein
MLNYELRAATSGVEGQGVYAAVEIPRRAKIGEITGELIPLRAARKKSRSADRIYFVDVSDTHAPDRSKGNILRFTNHSCKSNAFLRVISNKVEVYAKRDIFVDEEITVDYGETPHSGGMICRCGQQECRKVI